MKADLWHRTQAYLTDQLFDFTAHCSLAPTYYSFYFAPIKKSRKAPLSCADWNRVSLFNTYITLHTVVLSGDLILGKHFSLLLILKAWGICEKCWGLKQAHERGRRLSQKSTCRKTSTVWVTAWETQAQRSFT